MCVCARSHLVPLALASLGRTVVAFPDLLAFALDRALAPAGPVTGPRALLLAPRLRGRGQCRVVPQLRSAHHGATQPPPLLPPTATLARGEVRSPLRVAPQAEAAKVCVLALGHHPRNEHQRVRHLQQLAQRALRRRRGGGGGGARSAARASGEGHARKGRAP